MALDPHDILQDNPGKIGIAPSPLAGTREQRVQRLQVGLLGVAAMIMVVGLADIIMSTAENNSAAIVDDLAPVTDADVPPPPPSDPLAEAGVIPDLPAEPVEIPSPQVNQPEGSTLALPVEEGGDVPPPDAVN